MTYKDKQSNVKNDRLEIALRSIRRQELPHLSSSETRPRVPPLPNINEIGTDGRDHLNIARHFLDRNEVSYTLSMNNRVPFTLPGVECWPITSMGALYSFLRFGGHDPEGLNLDNTNAYKEFRKHYSDERPAKDMYAVFAFALHWKFANIEGFRELLEATHGIPYDCYLPAQPQQGRPYNQRDYDAAQIVNIYTQVSDAVLNNNVPNFFQWLDEATNIAFFDDPENANVGRKAAAQRKFAMDIIHAKLKEMGEMMTNWLAMREEKRLQSERDSARAAQQRQNASNRAKNEGRNRGNQGNNRRQEQPSPARGAAAMPAATGLTYDQLMNPGKVKVAPEAPVADVKVETANAQPDMSGSGVPVSEVVSHVTATVPEVPAAQPGWDAMNKGMAESLAPADAAKVIDETVTHVEVQNTSSPVSGEDGVVLDQEAQGTTAARGHDEELDVSAAYPKATDEAPAETKDQALNPVMSSDIANALRRVREGQNGQEG